MRYLLLRLKRFCGYITGFVFFVSGILKLMDPVGASLVMKEYFNFLHISFLEPTAMALGIFFAFAETAIGTGLITGVWRKTVAITAIAMQGFFTMVTIALVIFKPEMDCGCFGEAIHLTHGETFIKNLILLTLLLLYYIPKKHLGEIRKKKYISFALVMTSVIVFSVYSIIHLPLNDYTDYHAGASLKGENLPADSYSSVFIYEKDGQQSQFTIENLPDSTWTFVSTETTKTSEGEDIVSLSFYNEEGHYADSLALDGKEMIVSIYNTDVKDILYNNVYDFMRRAENAGFKTILLTSAPVDAPEGIRQFTADYKTLITLNRSNGGATYINDGIIIRKWSKKSLPADEELAKISEEDITEALIGNSHSSLTFQGFLLYVVAVMLLL